MLDQLSSIYAVAGSWLSALVPDIQDPSRRLYWVFILSSAMLAIIVVAYEKRSVNWSNIYRTLFNRQYWFNRSTLTDVSLGAGNSLLRILLLVPLLGSHLLITLWVARSLQKLGDAPDWSLPFGVIAVIYTLTFFLVEDFSRFALHRCMHKVPWLWRLHKVHHSATVLTPLTLQRVHPLEMTLYYLRGMLVFGGVSGVFVYLFGRQLSGLDVLGVDLLGFIFNLLGANLRHSHIWLSFGQFERWFISPAQHQIHHSSLPEHHDKNFGTWLAIWDRSFNSHLLAGTRKRLSFGLTQSVG